MKNLKRLLVLFVTVAMMMTMCLPMVAKAAGEGTEKKPATGKDSDTGIVKVTNVEVGATVMAYPIVKAVYDDDNFTGYVLENGYTLAEGKTYSDYPTAEQLAEIAKNPSALKGGKKLNDNEDKTYSLELGVGMYIVIVTGGTKDTTLYNPAVVSVNYVDDKGKTIIVPGKTDFKESLIKTEGNVATLKRTDDPTVEKEITNFDAKDKNGNKKGSSVDVGDTVQYKVTINPVPSYTGKYPVLNVVDTLSEGLTYADNLKVEVYDEETLLKTLSKGTDYITTNEEQKVTINFVKETKKDASTEASYEYLVQQYAGKKIVITYDATLNADATTGKDHNNNVVLNYTRDSKVEGDNKSKEDKTYTYTFDIDGEVAGSVIIKTDDSATPTPLDDATFALYKEDGTTPYSNANGDYNAIKSANGGKLTIEGLAAGTYWLQETAAPGGYSVNTHKFKIEIIANYNDKGQLTSWNYKVDDNDVLTITHTADNENTVGEGGTTIKNTKLSNLPSTGGIGTYAFTIVGVVIMVVAAGFLFLRRKENK